MSVQPQALPISALAADIRAQAGRHPLVITSPTGSGKSTEVPRYCTGQVLVVEPRRVACKALAARVADLEQCELGTAVGYHVRDDACYNEQTRILFVTPGIALRMADRFEQQAVIILDEFHERGLEGDLLFAVLKASHAQRTVVMSATLEAERIAAALGGKHLRAEGRAYPVQVDYLPEHALLPTIQGLDSRVMAAVLASHRTADGDLLVFLPGKGEISMLSDRLKRALPRDVEVLELHGGLTLQEQARVLATGPGQRVILTTNVAETSLTVPGITLVIDSGLVRRTRYHQGRGYLTLLPIANDSADQRTGRAGRLGPGRCIRLWSSAAKLEDVTAPEIHRESLAPAWLAAAAIGLHFDQLPFLDPPKPHAIEAALHDLQAIGALDSAARITRVGKAMFGLPLDPVLARLLVQARGQPEVQDVVDLVAALSVGRPLFTQQVDPADPDPLRQEGCDATALIRAVRVGDPHNTYLSAFALREARHVARRLRDLLELKERSTDLRVNRRALALLTLAAAPQAAHVTRTRKGRTAFSNGGTEVELGRDSCVGLEQMPPAIVVLGVRGLVDRGKNRILVTCACPTNLEVLVEAGLGRDRVARATLDGQRVVAHVERVYARRVLASREEPPTGTAARDALTQLLLAGRLGRGFREAVTNLRRSAAHGQLAHQLKTRRPRPPLDWDALPPAPGAVEDLLPQLLQTLGVEQADDIWLLSPEDLQLPALPYEIQALLDSQYPMEVELGEACYQVEYDLTKHRAVLNLTRGRPAHPPRRQFLPAFPGLTIFAEAQGRLHQVR